ncbi:MAG: hypothetical protein MZV63_22225 [Marinilabiliales bacterium]|nr:hypothetical protein [Marinilabiliales bacterium]
MRERFTVCGGGTDEHVLRRAIPEARDIRLHVLWEVAQPLDHAVEAHPTQGAADFIRVPDIRPQRRDALRCFLGMGSPIQMDDLHVLLPGARRVHAEEIMPVPPMNSTRIQPSIQHREPSTPWTHRQAKRCGLAAHLAQFNMADFPVETISD